MDLSIVILNYKTRGLVKTCVRGLLSVPTSYLREIIVVDNASRDGTPEMVAREFPSVRVIVSNSNTGFGGGNNAGIAVAQGRYIITMNPDIAVLDDALDRLVVFMDQNSDVGFVGPRLSNPDGSMQHSCYRFPTPMIPVYRRTLLGRLGEGQAALADYLMTDWDHAETRDVDWLLGACIMMRREVVEKIGVFDDRFFLYFEDTDLCRRAWEAGYRVVYHPEANIIHYHRRESAGSISSLFTNWITREHVKSGVKYFLKYRGKPLPRPAVIPSEAERSYFVN